MEQKIRCAHCGKLVRPNPRIRNQRYCSAAACQRARKTRWQKEKMAADPDYFETQRDYVRQWRKRNPHYWKRYRKNNPSKAQRNRILQRLRNNRRGSFGTIAKMDASKPALTIKPGRYYLLPVIAKMDTLKHEIYLISVAYP